MFCKLVEISQQFKSMMNILNMVFRDMFFGAHSFKFPDFAKRLLAGGTYLCPWVALLAGGTYLFCQATPSRLQLPVVVMRHEATVLLKWRIWSRWWLLGGCWGLDLIEVMGCTVYSTCFFLKVSIQWNLQHQWHQIDLNLCL